VLTNGSQAESRGTRGLGTLTTYGRDRKGAVAISRKEPSFTGKFDERRRRGPKGLPSTCFTEWNSVRQESSSGKEDRTEALTIHNQGGGEGRDTPSSLVWDRLTRASDRQGAQKERFIGEERKKALLSP